VAPKRRDPLFAEADDGVVVAVVGHHAFRAAGPNALRAFGKPGHALLRLNSICPHDQSDLRP
jgi:hypothetical protein